MGGRFRVETASSGRSIGHWWIEEAEPHLTRMYGKFNFLVSRENIVGDLLGQAVQPAA
jgi:hypothetical protein